MNDKILIENGFHSFSPGPFLDKDVELCFQKRYDNDKGKKYFITVNKWRPFTHPHTGETFPSAYEYTTQLYKKESHDALNLLFHSSWKLEDVESCLETLFATGMFDYYEKFDEE